MTKRRRPSAAQLRDKAELLRILAHPTRLAIVQKLSLGPKCVTDIHELLDVAQANVSQHLSLLRSYRVVDYHEDGKLRCYYLARPALAELIQTFICTEFPIVERSPEDVRQAGKKKRSQACG